MEIFPPFGNHHTIIRQNFLARHNQTADRKAAADIGAGAAGVNDKPGIIAVDHNGGGCRRIDLADSSGTDDNRQITDSPFQIVVPARFHRFGFFKRLLQQLNFLRNRSDDTK